MRVTGNNCNVVPNIYLLALSCPRFRQCHSSILNFKNSPGMIRGTNEPLGSAIFPSELRWHFPSRIYSVASGQCLMKCSILPQKLQLASSALLRGERSFSESDRLGNDVRASERRLTRFARLLTLVSDAIGAEAIAGDDVISKAS